MIRRALTVALVAVLFVPLQSALAEAPPRVESSGLDEVDLCTAVAPDWHDYLSFQVPTKRGHKAFTAAQAKSHARWLAEEDPICSLEVSQITTDKMSEAESTAGSGCVADALAGLHSWADSLADLGTAQSVRDLVAIADPTYLQYFDEEYEYCEPESSEGDPVEIVLGSRALLVPVTPSGSGFTGTLKTGFTNFAGSAEGQNASAGGTERMSKQAKQLEISPEEFIERTKSKVNKESGEVDADPCIVNKATLVKMLQLVGIGQAIGMADENSETDLPSEDYQKLEKKMREVQADLTKRGDGEDRDCPLWRWRLKISGEGGNSKYRTTANGKFSFSKKGTVDGASGGVAGWGGSPGAWAWSADCINSETGAIVGHYFGAGTIPVSVTGSKEGETFDLRFGGTAEMTLFDGPIGSGEQKLCALAGLFWPAVPTLIVSLLPELAGKPIELPAKDGATWTAMLSSEDIGYPVEATLTIDEIRKGKN